MTPEESMYQEAMDAIEKGDNARARDLLMRLIKLGPTKPDYWLWMSAMVETPKERIYCQKEVLKLDPQNADARQAIQMDVTLLPAYRLLGEAQVKAGLPGDAMTPLKIVTTYQGGDVQAWVWLGAAYGAQQDTDTALKAFSQALSLNKNFPDVYLQCGLVYIQIKDGTRAKADLTVAVRIKPDSFAAKMALGKANMLLQDYGGAWKQFAESESLAKTDAALAEMFTGVASRWKL